MGLEAPQVCDHEDPHAAQREEDQDKGRDASHRPRWEVPQGEGESQPKLKGWQCQHPGQDQIRPVRVLVQG